MERSARRWTAMQSMYSSVTNARCPFNDRDCIVGFRLQTYKKTENVKLRTPERFTRVNARKTFPKRKSSVESRRREPNKSSCLTRHAVLRIRKRDSSFSVTSGIANFSSDKHELMIAVTPFSNVCDSRLNAKECAAVRKHSTEH